MLKNDYIMKMISNKIKFLTKLLLGKDNPEFEYVENETAKKSNILHKDLIKLISENKINEAENILFSEFDPLDKNKIAVAIDFYNRLNTLDDETLKINDFTRKEIKEGLDDISKTLGMETYDL